MKHFYAFLLFHQLLEPRYPLHTLYPTHTLFHIMLYQSNHQAMLCIQRTINPEHQANNFTTSSSQGF